ncbi:MAG: response regulator [Deltaproteobacteria bacterium]|nr:response regulator [Deltaproteobacteria bacterium]MCW5807373.1 response regulator [Deltaproteobacteria bacterium]
MGSSEALIVLAEDDLALRALLAQALACDGHRVVAAEPGSRLACVVRELVDAGEPPGLIITDVRAPAGGSQPLGDLDRAIPLIVMTAYGDTWTRSRAAEHGAVLLDKPLSLGILRQVVRRILAGTASYG